MASNHHDDGRFNPNNGLRALYLYNEQPIDSDGKIDSRGAERGFLIIEIFISNSKRDRQSECTKCILRKWLYFHIKD